MFSDHVALFQSALQWQKSPSWVTQPESEPGFSLSRISHNKTITATQTSPSGGETAPGWMKLWQYTDRSGRTGIISVQNQTTMFVGNEQGYHLTPQPLPFFLMASGDGGFDRKTLHGNDITCRQQERGGGRSELINSNCILIRFETNPENPTSQQPPIWILSLIPPDSPSHGPWRHGHYNKIIWR